MSNLCTMPRIRVTKVEKFECNQLTEMIFCIYTGHANVVKLLIEHNADFNAKGNYKGTPLQIAATKG